MPILAWRTPKNACVGGYADARRCSYFELGLPVAHHAFFNTSQPSLHDYDLKGPSRFAEDGNTRQQYSFCFLELWYNPLEFNSKKISHLAFDELNEME